MRENKWICGFSILITIICIIIICFSNRETKIYDIALGILTGAFISATVSLASYYSIKRENKNKVIDMIIENLKKYIKILETINYVYDKRKLKEELEEKNSYEENSEAYTELVECNDKKINENIKNIMKMKQIDKEEFEKLFKDLLKLEKKKVPEDEIKYIVQSIEKIINLSETYIFFQNKAGIIYSEIQNIIYQDKEIHYTVEWRQDVELNTPINKLQQKIEKTIEQIKSI